MALQQKKKWAQLKVGLLAVASLCILAFLIFLMTSSKGLFKSRSEIYRSEEHTSELQSH